MSTSIAKHDGRRAHAVVRILIPIVSAAVFIAVYVSAVLTNRGQLLEDRALSAAPINFGSLPLLHLVSVPDLAIALVILIAIAALRRRLDLVAVVILIIGLSNVATQVLKYGVLHRPDLVGLLAENTFPSGHTTAYVSVMFAGLVAVPPVIRSVLSVPAAFICSAVGVELLGYGWHRLSDIVGAAALVTCIASVAVLVVRRPRPNEREPILRRASARIIGLGVLAALALSLAVFGAALIAHSSADSLMLIGTEGIATATILIGFLAFGYSLRARGERRDVMTLTEQTAGV